MSDRGRFLVISRELDAVIATGATVEDAAVAAVAMGYAAEDCYLDNQDGGRAELAEVIEQYDIAHAGHFSRLGGTYWCDTCNSPYCDLA